MKAAALALARQGYAVFPCRPNGKEPLHKGSFKDATVDEFQIEAWWNDCPEANIAIYPHACHVRLMVVDADVKEQENGLVTMAGEVGTYPPTRVVTTPSGGEHHYYQLPDGVTVQSSARRLGPGLDVRSHGGYVLVPPSVVDGKQYRLKLDNPIVPAPARLVAIAGTPEERHPDADKWLCEPDLPANIERAREWLRREVEQGSVAIEFHGGDNFTYATAAVLRDYGLSEQGAVDLLLLHWNPYCMPPWHPDDIDRIVTNAYRYTKRPAGNRVAFPDSLRRMADSTTLDAKNADDTFPILRGAEMLKQPDIRYLVSRTIPDTSLGLFWGNYGSFKTFVLIYVALCWSLGWKVFGQKSHHPRRVAYIAAEGAAGVRRRIAGFVKKHGLKPEDVKVDVIPVAPVILERPEFAKLVRTLKDGGYGMVIVDTLSRIIPGRNENDQGDMSLLVDVCSRLINELGVTVILVHHPPKTGGSSRGSNVLPAAVDFEFEVEKEDARTALVTNRKMKDDEQWSEPRCLRAERVETDWKDEDGRKLATLVLEYDQTYSASDEKAQKKVEKGMGWYNRVADTIERESEHLRKTDPNHPLDECAMAMLVATLKGQSGYSSSTLHAKLEAWKEYDVAGRKIVVEMRGNPRGGAQTKWFRVVSSYDGEINAVEGDG